MSYDLSHPIIFNSLGLKLRDLETDRLMLQFMKVLTYRSVNLEKTLSVANNGKMGNQSLARYLVALLSL